MKLKPNISTDEQGREVYSLSIIKANLFAIILMLPLAMLAGIPFYLLWGENILQAFEFRPLILLFLFVILGIAFHELLHGSFWAIFAQGGFRAIKFGIKWDYLTPYCHCKKPLRVWQYLIGALAPLFFLGIIPSVWAMIFGNPLIMFLGLFFMLAAAGDILAALLLLRFKFDQLVSDHPSELGFIVEHERSTEY